MIARAAGAAARTARVAAPQTAERFCRALGKSLGRMVHASHRVFSKRRLESVAVEHVAGHPLIVIPGVLNPKLMRTGAFFAQALAREPLVDGAQVLDLGTGSGVCAVTAARRAKHIVAVDVSAAAVRCARINALVHGLEQRIEVLHGDLFAPVSDRAFDLVLFNPPFLCGEPRDDADRAWRSLDVAERFAAGLRARLAPRGSALLLLSTFGDAGLFLRPLERHGFAITVRARQWFINERLTLFRVWPELRSAGAGPGASAAGTHE